LKAQLPSLASVQLATYAQVARVLQHLPALLPSLIIQPATQDLVQLDIFVPMDQVIQDHVLLDTIKIQLVNQAVKHAQLDIIVLKEVLQPLLEHVPQDTIVLKVQSFTSLMTIKLVEFALQVIIALMDLNTNVRTVHTHQLMDLTNAMTAHPVSIAIMMMELSLL
jgi:hypothetical protein